MNSETNIILPISINYVSEWGIWEALRELSQNSLDHADKSCTKPVIRYYKNSKTMLFVSEDIKLDISSLVLGNGTKTEDGDQRGQFGEGYKLALIVLLRLGINITIYNNNEIWTPIFKYNELFKAEILTINILPTNNMNNKDLVIKLTGVLPDQAATTKHRILLNRFKAIGHPTKYGTILTEKRFKGQIFVGGVYVTTSNLNLTHGYDFNPAEVSLGRDRGLIDSFDIQWLTSKMWAVASKLNKKVLEETAKLIKTNQDCVEYLHNYSINNTLTKKISDDFYNQHSNNAIPVLDEYERKSMSNAYNNAIPIVVSRTEKSIITNSSQYINTMNTVFIKGVILTPEEHIALILRKYVNDFGPLYNDLSNELLTASLKWISK